jgi:hypothetical protein
VVEEQVRRRSSLRAANALVVDDDAVSAGTVLRRCECGDESCSTWVEVQEEDYRRARRRDGGFIVAVEHVDTATDRPVMHVGQACVVVARTTAASPLRETFAYVRRRAKH